MGLISLIITTTLGTEFQLPAVHCIDGLTTEGKWGYAWTVFTLLVALQPEAYIHFVSNYNDPVLMDNDGAAACRGPVITPRRPRISRDRTILNAEGRG